MVRWLAATVVLFLLLAPSAFGQFTGFFGYTPQPGDNPPLTTTCGGSTPIPDGRIVKVFWDNDSDGPDVTDPLAPLCEHPPSCEGDMPGFVTMNQFLTNGVTWGDGAGYFYTDQVSFSAPAGAPNPSRFYLRIYEPDGINILWTSAVKTIGDGYQEINFVRADWTCGATGPQCIVRDEHE